MKPGMTELNMPDMPDEYQSLQHEIVECQICPRLTLHRQQVAGKKRRAYADWDYWGKPVPSLGEPDALDALDGFLGAVPAP